jgi:drug/metabolite transporter (DMT)-like permease
MEKKKLNGHIAILTANIIFGLNTPISRSLIPTILSPFALTFARILGATILFWIASIFFKKERVNAKDLYLLFFASLFALSINQLPFFIGLSRTSPIDASIVVSMLPIVTMILAAIFIKEPITFKKALGVLVGASGALLLIFSTEVLHKGESNFWGNLIVFSAVVSFAIYLAAFKAVVSRYSSITVMKWMFLFASVVCFPFCYDAVKEIPYSSLTLDTYLRVSYVVILSTFFSYLLIAIAQKVLRPTTFSMYNYLQPIMASLASVAMGMDYFGMEHALSSILVFAGVYLVTQSKSRMQIIEESKQNPSC